MSIIAVPADIQKMSQGYIRPAFKQADRKVEANLASAPTKSAADQREQTSRPAHVYDADGSVTYENDKKSYGMA